MVQVLRGVVPETVGMWNFDELMAGGSGSWRR
jgi:hypothetical protein